MTTDPDRIKEIEEMVSNLYEESGGDPSRCEFCDEPLDEERPYRRGLDGAGAHEDCLTARGLHGGKREEVKRMRKTQ